MDQFTQRSRAVPVTRYHRRKTRKMYFEYCKMAELLSSQAMWDMELLPLTRVPFVAYLWQKGDSHINAMPLSAIKISINRSILSIHKRQRWSDC